MSREKLVDKVGELLVDGGGVGGEQVETGLDFMLGDGDGAVQGRVFGERDEEVVVLFFFFASADAARGVTRIIV